MLNTETTTYRFKAGDYVISSVSHNSIKYLTTTANIKHTRQGWLIYLENRGKNQFHTIEAITPLLKNAVKYVHEYHSRLN